jgi:acetylornithine deacetylase/succinyl-diaminopimelate desuccinylase-like protein
MTVIKKVDKYIEEKLDQNLKELSEFCSIAGISAKNTFLSEAADYTKNMFEKRGFATQVFTTEGAPVVFAERKGKSDKTLLFYNHYDVQPAEPLALWKSDPFQAEIRDGKMYARGVSDDKGHLTSRLFAIDALLDQMEELPCNIKFIVEGEEETSSMNLEAFVKTHADLLKADGCVWEFGAVDFDETPLQYLGLRGICYVELEVETANQDVHSGIGGSIFPNAAWRLIWALNTLKDSDENILIPGFYDDVLPPTEEDIQFFQELPDKAKQYHDQYGIEAFLGGLQGGVELAVAEVFHPTCTICGLTSGYQGPGSKTVLPAKASAKIDFRLVPDQKPEKILALLREHLDRQGFSDVKVTYLGGGAPGRTDPFDPFVQVVVNAANEVYEKQMKIVPMVGGSGPNSMFIEHLNIPIVTAGIGYSETLSHAPNENIRLADYIKGAKHIARIILNF